MYLSCRYHIGINDSVTLPFTRLRYRIDFYTRLPCAHVLLFFAGPGGWSSVSVAHCRECLWGDWQVYRRWTIQYEWNLQGDRESELYVFSPFRPNARLRPNSRYARNGEKYFIHYSKQKSILKYIWLILRVWCLQVYIGNFPAVFYINIKMWCIHTTSYCTTPWYILSKFFKMTDYITSWKV